MERQIGGRCAVLGMGNPLCADDGAGIAALRLLERSGAVPKRTALIDGSVLGLETAAMIMGADHLLILDAVEAGAAPGTLIRMAGDALAGMMGGSSVHRLGVADVLAVLRLMGRMPEDVVLLGVQPVSTEPGQGLTPPVLSSLPALVSASIRLISEWEAGPAR